MTAILVTSKTAKQLGKPAGSLISYDEAPEWLRKRHDAAHAELSEDAAERIAAQTKAALETARHIREPFGATA